jgi:hypothetical protein
MRHGLRAIFGLGRADVAHKILTCSGGVPAVAAEILESGKRHSVRLGGELTSNVLTNPG